MSDNKDYARMNGSLVVERFTVPDGFTLADCFHPDAAALFVACPPETVQGSTVDEAGNWTHPEPSPAPQAAPVTLPVLTPMEFYLAFTPAERMAIKASTDPMAMEFWATYQLAVQLGSTINPNLVSVQQGIGYLAQLGILASLDRVAQILAGVAQ